MMMTIDPQIFDEFDEFELDSSVASLNEKKPRKKKCGRQPTFRPEYMPGLQIFRNDIRRRLPLMYANVMNSLDPKIMNEFFYKFGSPHIIYERKHDTCAFSHSVTTLAPNPIRGLSEFTQSIITLLTSGFFFDTTVQIKNPKVIIQKDVPGSRIAADNILDITLLYSVKKVSRSVSSQYQVLPAPGFECVDPFTGDLFVFSLLSTPLRFTVESQLTISLDCSKRIDGIFVNQLHSVSKPVNLSTI